MRQWIQPFVLLSVIWAAAGAAVAQDTGAKGNGSWETGSIWTGGTVPNSSSTVYIGSTYPSGAAATATVTMAANQSASYVYLGYGSGTSGALDLGGNKLTITNSLVLGESSGATGVLNESGGSFTAATLDVLNANSLTFGASDVVSYLQLSGGSSATTMATGNVTGSSDVYSGSTLTLGADLSLTGYLNVQDGSTFNAAGHDITAANEVFFGWNGSSAVTLQNLGNITANNLYVGNGMTFNPSVADTVNNFYLNTGASSTLTIDVSYLQLNNGSSATTTANGTVMGSSDVYSGSTLTLGANLSPSGYLNVQDGSTFNAAGHDITAASQVFFGWYGSSAVTLQNLGNITATSLYIGNGMTFNLTPADTVTNFYLNAAASSTLTNNVSAVQLNNGSSVTTTATGTVTGNIDVYSGSTLTLGANLSLSSYLNVQDGSTFNAQGHALTADTLYAGWYGSSSATISNLGIVALNNLYVGNSTTGSALTLHGGDVINSTITLTNGSVLTVQETGGIGLTFNGTSASALTIDPSSMDLVFTVQTTPNWDFRWADPSSGGNWVSTLDSMIASGQINLSGDPYGYSVVDNPAGLPGGYTYIEGNLAPSTVPEPSALLLGCLAVVGVAAGMKWRRRDRRSR